MLTKRGEKGEEKFVCNKCAFICSDKWKWERHIFTRKHLNTYQYLPKKGNICKKKIEDDFKSIKSAFMKASETLSQM